MTPFDELVAAAQANDLGKVREAFRLHPELRARLNQPFPGACFGATPLLLAVQHKNRGLIEVLLENGADINGRSDWWAGSFGVLDSDSGLESFLIERGAVVDAHAAARLGMLDRLKELVRNDPAIVHTRGGDGQTPLHFACSIEVADFLLDHGANIDALDVDHESTPAQWMIRERTDLARHLVKRGCRADLLLVSALGDLERVQKHLEADPNCIRMSVSNEWFPMRDRRAGGSIYIWTLGQNKTPHSVARDFGHEKVFHFLMEQSPDDVKFAQACELGEQDLFNKLLAKNPELIRNLNADTQRKLVNAAQDNNTKAVQLMLEAGWPVDARGQHGGTALHWACFHGNAAMAKIILQHRPSLELKDDDFKATPLGWAVHGSLHGWHAKTGDYAGAVEALLPAGARLPKPVAEIDASPAVRAVLGRLVA